MDNTLLKTYKTPKTVLTIKDLALLWQETNQDNLKAKTAYYVKQGALRRLQRGVFAKADDYDPKELASSLYSPSYVSFETVLYEAGVIFQYFDAVFAAGPYSINKQIDSRTYVFRKLKDQVLFNPRGIKNTETGSIATPERAFLDMIYLFPDYYFDNLKPLDWEKCYDLLGIYDNTRMAGRLNKYWKVYSGKD